ncbi:MAG TPA: Txe/YoeB family addiction module toxin [Verrucomicrobiae bacterium]|nr:Txe/YoeB family addiction module toxin [Verrucomicrobiae bacterium]
MSWSIVYTKQAQKDAKQIAASNLKSQAKRLIEILARDPFQTPPPFEKLLGDLAGAYSRRINIQHRLVYQLYSKQRTVKILRMWTHYE